MRACQKGALITVRWLIEKMGALPQIANKNDENCLIIAVRNRQTDIVRYLCGKVLKPLGPLEVDYECSRNGLTAFARAVLSNDNEIADILLN